MSGGRGANRHDLVVVAMKDQRRHVELLEVFGEIRLGERLDAVEGVLVTRLHPWSQNESIMPCETLAPGLLAPKNGPPARSL